MSAVVRTEEWPMRSEMVARSTPCVQQEARMAVSQDMERRSLGQAQAPAQPRHH
jgi:hypothetical protein